MITKQELMDFMLKTSSAKFCFLIHDLLKEPKKCEFFGRINAKKSVFAFKFYNIYAFYGPDAVKYLKYISKELAEVSIIFEEEHRQKIDENFHKFRRGDPTGSGSFNTYLTMKCSNDDFREKKIKTKTNIRRITTEDITSNLPQAIQNFLSSPDTVCYGSIIDNHVVNCVPIPNLYLGNDIPRFGIIRGVWTDPRYRGLGLASISLRILCEDMFHKLKLKEIYIWVERSNLVAQKIYKKLGFQVRSSWLGSRCYFK